jgi:hypothetical protein
MKFTILNADGVVIRTGHAPQEDHELQVQPGERLFKGDADLGQIVHAASGLICDPPAPPAPPLSIRQQRAAHYPAIADQLDALWHAMDTGLLPRVPGFYDEILAVKNAIPKED